MTTMAVTTVQTTDELIALVAEWGRARGLTGPDHLERQVLKTVEEVGELAAAVTRGQREEAADAIGDTIVTLVLVAEKMGLSVNQCLQDVYEVISRRTGTTVDGVFIKAG